MIDITMSIYIDSLLISFSVYALKLEAIKCRVQPRPKKAERLRVRRKRKGKKNMAPLVVTRQCPSAVQFASGRELA
jgi:hypothetical protein